MRPYIRQFKYINPMLTKEKEEEAKRWMWHRVDPWEITGCVVGSATMEEIEESFSIAKIESRKESSLGRPPKIKIHDNFRR